MILKVDGSLWAFGGNSRGQLGNGSNSQQNTPTQIISTGVAQVATGYQHSMILKTDGSLWTYGWNSHGTLGNGSTSDKNYPIQILSSGVSKIAAEYVHNMFLKADGSFWTFGYNSEGQLGDGGSSNRNTPIQIISTGVAQLSGSTSTLVSANVAPVITQGAGPLTKTVAEDGLASWAPSELNATDADTASGSLTWSVSSAASNGTATVTGSGASPTTFTYQPDNNFNGSDSFDVRVSDGNLSDTITVNVTVTAVNDAPLITQGGGPLTKTVLKTDWMIAELNA